MPEELDNTNNAPEEGQAEVSAEEQLGKMMMGEQSEEQTQVEENQTEEQPQQVVKVGNKEYESYEEAINDYKEAYEKYGDPAELRKKLSQRDEKAKYGEQFQQFFQQHPEAQKLLQTYQQNPEVVNMVDKLTDPQAQTLLKAYEKGMIKREKLQKVQQYLSQQGQSQSKSIDPNQIQEMVNQQVNQNLSVYQAKMDMQNQYKQLSQDDKYGDYLQDNNLDFDNLSRYAIQRQLIDPQTNKVDMEKAVNLYAAENNDIQTLIQKTAENNVQKVQQQKNQATVERPSNKQQSNQNEQPNTPDWAKYALEPRNSGSGF
jgi:hypothetical protein